MAPDRDVVHESEELEPTRLVSPVLKLSALKDTDEISVFASPVATVLFHVGIAVLPNLNAPDVPVAPATEILAAVTVGMMVSMV